MAIIQVTDSVFTITSSWFHRGRQSVEWVASERFCAKIGSAGRFELPPSPVNDRFLLFQYMKVSALLSKKTAIAHTLEIAKAAIMPSTHTRNLFIKSPFRQSVEWLNHKWFWRKNRRRVAQIVGHPSDLFDEDTY